MRHRLKFFIKRLLRLLLLLFGVSVITFSLLCLSPIDPLQANLGQAALGSMSQEQIQQLQDYWGADTPPLLRYFSWLRGALGGDLGVSLLYRRPVTEVIGEGLGVSFWMLAAAWVLGGLLGLGLGVLSGALGERRCGKAIRDFCLLLSSTPTFWLALLLLWVFSLQLGWLPMGMAAPAGLPLEEASLLQRVRHALLPALTLSLSSAAPIALHTREKLLEVLERDYILLCRARGESQTSILLRHGLRGVLLPAITLHFASVGEVLGGSVLVEQVFSYPGLGQIAVQAGLGGDLPLLMGITLFTAAAVFAGNLTADLLYGLIDPRIRRGAART